MNRQGGSSPARPDRETATSEAALTIARHPNNTYLGARYKRIIVRRGKMKALVATEHSILTATWHLLAEGECFQDPGSDFFTNKDPDKTKNNAIRRLQALRYEATIDPRQAARLTLQAVVTHHKGPDGPID